MAPVAILSIDGGGIRGIIPAVILQALESRLGGPAYKSFDLIAGTSTGGIIALGLTTRPAMRPGQPAYSAQDLVGLYEKEGPKIFERSFWHAVEAIDNLNGPKYDGDGIEQVLSTYFGDARLKDCLTRVLVTSYELETRRPFFFKSWAAKGKPARDFAVKDVARATSAAPTYFPPEKIGPAGGAPALIDGGVFANNPAMCALAEAHRLFPPGTEFLLLSLGTGNPDRPIPYDQAKGWGLAGWAHPLIDILIDGVSDTVHYELTKLLPAGNYLRLQGDVPREAQNLDDTSTHTLNDLKQAAGQIIANSPDLDRFAGRLKR